MKNALILLIIAISNSVFAYSEQVSLSYFNTLEQAKAYCPAESDLIYTVGAITANKNGISFLDLKENMPKPLSMQNDGHISGATYRLTEGGAPQPRYGQVNHANNHILCYYSYPAGEGRTGGANMKNY
jgi:hypothetical protein